MPLLDFPFFGWLRDLLGIRKDIIDTKKSRLEIQKLQDEELARNLITRATIADIEKYDPKYSRIKATALSGSDNLTENGADKNIRTRHWFWVFFSIFGLLGLIFVVYNSLARLTGSRSESKNAKNKLPK